MQVISRGLATGAAGAVAAGLLNLADPGAAATPRHDWTGAKQLVVVCRAVAETPAATAGLCDGLGRRVAKRATDRATLPVVVATFGDARMFAFDSVVLLVNARAETVANDRLLTFALRPWRAIEGDNNDLFGAPPRVARVAADGGGAELDAAIDRTLDDILPWRQDRR